MGTRFRLMIDHADAEAAGSLLDRAVLEIRRLEALLTEFSDSSVTAQLNRLAGIKPVAVPAEVYSLLERCVELSALTQGAFDITIGPLKDLYRFDRGSFRPPPVKTLRNVLSRTGYRHIRLLGNGKVMLERPGMRLSFASCGKGLAADSARRILQSAGVPSGAVDASGDLTTWGRARRIAIANPRDPEQPLYYLPLANGSVATSGDYEQHYIYRGKRYSHNINPRTGQPLTGISSVTVTGPRAELCDALATAVYTMGANAGIHLLNQLPGVHGIVIDDKHQICCSDDIDLQAA